MTTSRKKAVLLKVLLLGESCVGKTSIFHRYVKDEYSQAYKATIGADFFSKDLKVDEKEVILQIWDTAGQERYQSLGVTFFRGSDACILVYDITDRRSFEALTSWVEQFLQGVGASPASAKDSGYIFVVLGNKCDLAETRQVPTTEAEDFCKENGFQFFETSAKSGFNVQDAFEYIARKGIEKSESQSSDFPVTEIVAGGISIDDGASDEEDEAGCTQNC